MKKLIVLFILFFSASIFAQKKIESKVVDAGCAMCMFKQKTAKGCAMAVKIDKKVYLVEGVDKKEFGEMHTDDGYCKMIKKAQVSGEIRNGKFFAKKFKFVEDKK